MRESGRRRHCRRRCGFDAILVARAVADGRYRTPSEAVHAALSFLAEEDDALRRLREAIADGEASGYDDAPFDVDRFLDSVRREQ